MYFIRDLNGGIINIGRAARVFKDGTTSTSYVTVKASVDGVIYDLFKGDAAECGNFVDQLFFRLARHQEHEYVV